MTSPTDREKDRIRAVTGLLHQACKPIRILRALDWAPEVKESFLAGGGRELPQVTYPPFDPTPSIDLVREARRQIVPFTTIDVWLERHAQSIELGARMLAAVGTPSFFEFGRQLYGEPTAPLRYVAISPLELAQSVLDTIDQLAHIDISTAPPAYHSAEEVAVNLDRAVRAHFGDQAPAIELVDRLSANALATSRRRSASAGAPASPTAISPNCCITRPSSTSPPPSTARPRLTCPSCRPGIRAPPAPRRGWRSSRR